MPCHSPFLTLALSIFIFMFANSYAETQNGSVHHTETRGKVARQYTTVAAGEGAELEGGGGLNIMWNVRRCICQHTTKKQGGRRRTKSGEAVDNDSGREGAGLEGGELNMHNMWDVGRCICQPFSRRTHTCEPSCLLVAKQKHYQTCATAVKPLHIRHQTPLHDMTAHPQEPKWLR